MKDVKADDSARSNVCVSAVWTLSWSSGRYSKERTTVGKRNKKLHQELHFRFELVFELLQLT